jgi:hypothetical protein
MNWKKTLMYGSFAAGAVLFFTGRRPAGLVVAGIGVAALAADNPEKFQELWHRLPHYLDTGAKYVNMAATFLEQTTQQDSDGHRDMPAAGGGRY